MNLFKPALNLARVLGIADDALESLFDSLEVLGILEQWREVPPFQILPRWESPSIYCPKPMQSPPRM